MMILIIIMLAVLIIGLLAYVYYIHIQDRQIVQINKEREQENLKIEQDIKQKQVKLEELKKSIEDQNNTLQNFITASENMRETAIRQAKEAHDSQVSALLEKYKEKEQNLIEEYAKKIEANKHILEIEEQKVENLKAKQLAYIQAKQREEEKQTKQDYYRLVISDIDKQDITLLREVQARIGHKDAIDKVIYEVYYKPAYNLLMSHLFDITTQKVSGIYMITNLINGQSYIGQSVDIRERIKQHIKTSLSSSPATNILYQQMKQYGLFNFTFEILEIVPRDKLNERETYWIDFYKTKDFGMNGTKGGA